MKESQKEASRSSSTSNLHNQVSNAGLLVHIPSHRKCLVHTYLLYDSFLYFHFFPFLTKKKKNQLFPICKICLEYMSNVQISLYQLTHYAKSHSLFQEISPMLLSSYAISAQCHKINHPSCWRKKNNCWLSPMLMSLFSPNLEVCVGWTSLPV